MSPAATWCRVAYRKINNVYKIGGYVSRDAVTIADYKINWVRPQKVSQLTPEKSGDLGVKVEVKPTEYQRYYELSKELEDANDIVKKMFTLEFQPRKELEILRREKTINLVKRHIADSGSAEVNIAQMTIVIQRLQKYMEEHPKNIPTKVFLKELIDKRNKMLRYMRVWDYKRFEWLLERLNLVFKPSPEIPGWVTRRNALTKLTEDHCNNIIQTKLNAYKAELKAQQKDFYREKAEKLEFIRKEEIECGVTPTVSEEDIQQARKMMEAL